MTPALTPEQIAEIEALLEKAASGPWSADSTVFFGDIERARDVSLLVALRNAAPALIAMAKRPKWLCFHCGFETSNEAEAEGHFGPGDGEPAMCVHWSELSEDERLKAYQETEIELNGALDEGHKALQRAEKAEAQADEITVLRVQASRDYAALLRWDGEDFMMGALRVGRAWPRLSIYHDNTGWQANTVGPSSPTRHPTEGEARAAVEIDVREALGVKSPPAADKDAHMDCYQYGTVTSEPARNCKTCQHYHAPIKSERCYACDGETLSLWTPKTTASEAQP